MHFCTPSLSKRGISLAFLKRDADAFAGEKSEGKRLPMFAIQRFMYEEQQVRRRGVSSVPGGPKQLSDFDVLPHLHLRL